MFMAKKTYRIGPWPNPKTWIATPNRYLLGQNIGHVHCTLIKHTVNSGPPQKKNETYNLKWCATSKIQLFFIILVTVLGWSNRSFNRHNPNASRIKCIYSKWKDKLQNARYNKKPKFLLYRCNPYTIWIAIIKGKKKINVQNRPKDVI